ncbi:unnamed protein product [Closterium sp. NIES-65]|nr:unnamed protein product [Closterium sp. NIES-65]
MASSAARSAGEGTSVSSVAGASPSAGLLGIPPAATPPLPPFQPLRCHRGPPASTACGLPVVVPRLSLPAVPTSSSLQPLPLRSSPLLPLSYLSLPAPHWWRGLGFPAPASARPASLSARWRSPQPLRREMAADALALVATALAAASPGGVPGRQVPALLQAASVLAGRGASSRERRKRRRQSREPVYHSPPDRVRACSSGSGGRTTAGEVKPPSEAAAVSAADTPPTVPAVCVPSCAILVPSAAAAASVSSSSAAPSASAALAAAAKPSLDVGGMVPSEQSAAVAAATEMLHYLPLIGLVPGAPGAALGPGPGAMMRLAESAQQAPLGLVSAAASVLRWMDGRLCWILAE